MLMSGFSVSIIGCPEAGGKFKQYQSLRNNPLAVEIMGVVVAVVVACDDMLDADVMAFGKVVG